MRQKKSMGGFTLVELLVVIGIIALLISILMPALSRAKDQANRIKCMAHLRQVVTGMVMYAGENKGALPWVNWGGNYFTGKPGDTKGTAGWLYDAPSWDQGAKDPSWDLMEGGMVFRYIKNREVFKCPLHVANPGSYSGPSEKYTSYLMNGAACDYNTGNLFTYKASRFKPDDIIIWETGESNLMRRLDVGPPFNDGSSFAFEWLSERHGASGRKTTGGVVLGNGGASVGCVDGHVEWFSYKEYDVELDKPVKRPGRSRLWISPTLKDGGWYPKKQGF